MPKVPYVNRSQDPISQLESDYSQARLWSTTIKTFRTKRDAQDWARRTENEMVQGVYVNRAKSDRLLLGDALDRYLREISPTKKPTTASAECHKAKAVKNFFSDFSLAAISPDLVAEY